MCPAVPTVSAISVTARARARDATASRSAVTSSTTFTSRHPAAASRPASGARIECTPAGRPTASAAARTRDERRSELGAVELRRHGQAERDREIPRADVERLRCRPRGASSSTHSSAARDSTWAITAMSSSASGPSVTLGPHRPEAASPARWVERREHSAPRLLHGVDVRDDDSLGAEIEDAADLDRVVRAESHDRGGAVRLDRGEERRKVALGEKAVLEIEDDVVDASGGEKLCRAGTREASTSAPMSDSPARSLAARLGDGSSGAGGGDGRRDLVDLAVGERADVEQEPAVAHDPDDRRLAGAERIEQRLLDRAGEARELLQRERAAADAGDRLLDLAADAGRRAARRAPAPPRPARPASASTGISLRARSGSRASASVPSSAASVSLSARSARCSGCRRIRSIRSARPARIPACGPPSSLSPEKQTMSAPAARLAAGVGSSPIGESAPEPRSSTSGSPARVRKLGELGERRLLGEPDDAEVRLVHAQDQRPSPGRARARSRRRACGSSCRPRRAARPSGPARRGSGSRRRSRSARRARRAPRALRRAPRGRASRPRRCC